MKRFILLLLLSGMISFNSSAQSRWIQQYLNEYNASAHELIISYDQGYLLSGWITHFTWLIKTDVNGEVLWQKLIGDSFYSSIAVDDVCFNTNGDIYLGGGAYNNGDANPVLIKLNPCGEKEWCREIVTTSNIDFFSDIVNSHDGGCATLIYKTFFPESINRSGILKFSSEGDLLWQKYYESSDPGVGNEDLSNIIITPDKGFLISGFCYYPDPENANLYWLHPYYIKTDSIGNFEWETVVHKETGDIGGQAFMTLVDPKETYYYSCISHYYTSDTLYTTRPAMVKLDLQGNVVGIYDLVRGNYDLGKIMTFDFLNDSVMVGSASWRNEEDDPQSRVIIFDTLGHITDSVTVMNDYFLGFVKTTFDDKILIFKSDNTDGELDPTLIKLNMNLEQDTFYTRPFVYDSLCPYQIASDTIVPDDCGVIVGVEEHGGMEAGKQGSGEAWGHGGLEVWPNPASEEIHVRWSMDDGRFYTDLEFWIYDVFGRITLSPPLGEATAGDRNWTLDVSSLPSGIYLLVANNGGSIIGSTKFIVSKP